jgi:hypothetical protein
MARDGQINHRSVVPTYYCLTGGQQQVGWVLYHEQ